MAKATPEEKAMHAAAEKEIDEVLEKQIENPAPVVTEKAEETTFTQEQPRRKRGRPSNAERALEDVLQKETVGDDTASPGTAAKPGRKSNKSGLIDAGALGQQLVGIHALAAMMLQIPELQLTPPEGDGLAKAVIAVCQEYNLSLSGKTGAGIQLFAAAAMIYAPRLLMYKSRIHNAQADNKGDPNVQHAPIHPTS